MRAVVVGVMIHAKSPFPALKSVPPRGARRQQRKIIVVLIGPKKAVISVPANCPAVSAAIRRERRVTRARVNQTALRVTRAPGLDVDDAVYRVGPPDRRARSANHF